MITIDDFKKFFKHDFQYLPEGEAESDEYVLDSDIERAILECEIILNEQLYGESDAALRLAQLYLSAHLLVGAIRMANSGLASAYAFPVTSRSVGSVSESYGIPTAYLQDPAFAMFIDSEYGLRFLAMSLGRIRGHVSIAGGATLP